MAYPRLCLGTMMFGTAVDEPTSVAILDRFCEAGGTFLDTADCYAFWHDGGTGRESEELLGRWLADRRCRDELLISTKLGSQPVAGRGDAWPRSAEGLSAATVFAASEGSRRRLGTDHLDVLFAHIEDRSVELAETVEAFGKLIADGGIGAAGVSNHPTSRVKQARAAAAELGVPGYTVIQQRHSFLTPRPGATFDVQEAADEDLMAYIRSEPDLTLQAYSPLLGGAFSRPDRGLPGQYRWPENARRLRELKRVAADFDATPNQLALAWLLHSDPPVIPVLGVSTITQLDEALGAVDVNPAAVATLRDALAQPE